MVLDGLIRLFTPAHGALMYIIPLDSEGLSPSRVNSPHCVHFRGVALVILSDPELSDSIRITGHTVDTNYCKLPTRLPMSFNFWACWTPVLGGGAVAKRVAGGLHLGRSCTASMHTSLSKLRAPVVSEAWQVSCSNDAARLLSII